MATYARQPHMHRTRQHLAQYARPQTQARTGCSFPPSITSVTAFRASRSRLFEPFRLICIKSCRFCISFACNAHVTHADVLKMAFPAGPWKPEKHAKSCFSTLTPQHIQTVARLQTRTCRSQALPFVGLVEALRDALPQALFRQTPRGHSPAARRPAFSEMTLFNFGAFR